MSAFKPGTRVVKVALYGWQIERPIGTLGTVANRRPRDDWPECDMAIDIDGIDIPNASTVSKLWRPLDDNDPCADSFADVLRKLDKVMV